MTTRYERSFRRDEVSRPKTECSVYEPMSHMSPCDRLKWLGVAIEMEVLWMMREVEARRLSEDGVADLKLQQPSASGTEYWLAIYSLAPV